MNTPARFTLSALALGVVLVSPALGETPHSDVWTCRVERRIEGGRTQMYDANMRADPSLRFRFAADTAGNRGCLLDAADKNRCEVEFTGAAESGGMLRLDRMDERRRLDLVNIFPLSGRFIRVHGDVQWMGKAGDCTREPRPTGQRR